MGEAGSCRSRRVGVSIPPKGRFGVENRRHRVSEMQDRLIITNILNEDLDGALQIETRLLTKARSWSLLTLFT